MVIVCFRLGLYVLCLFLRGVLFLCRRDDFGNGLTSSWNLEVRFVNSLSSLGRSLAES